MSYKLKTKEFTLAMQLLAGMVQLETDLDVIDVSAIEFKATFPIQTQSPFTGTYENINAGGTTMWSTHFKL